MKKSKAKQDTRTYHSDEKNYRPNFYPVNQRFAYLVLSIILLVYAIVCIYYDDFALSGKRRMIYLHNYSAWLMLLAFFATAVNLFSFFIDHYDKRNNEHKYERFAKISRKIGWFFFVLALVLSVVGRF